MLSHMYQSGMTSCASVQVKQHSDDGVVGGGGGGGLHFMNYELI